MVAGFLFDLYEYTKETPKLLSIYYKFADYCFKNGYPILAQEKYVKDPEFYRAKGYWSVTEDAQNIHMYKVLKFENLKKCTTIISEEDEKEIIKEYNQNNIVSESLSKCNKKLMSIIEDFIEKHKNIEAFITWVWDYSLEEVCKKHNIRIINMELTTIRRPNYNDRLGYFSFNNKYDSTGINDLYKEFEQNKKLILSRKEILALFLNTTDLPYLNEMNSMPQYDLGYASGLNNDMLEKKYCEYSFDDITNKLKKIYNSKEVLLRPHPALKRDSYDDFYELDNSIRSFQWLCKCKNIICGISNVGYEAMLFGRGVTHISDTLPTSFNKKYDLSFINDEVINIEKLNFLTFAIYTPYELMFDDSYVKWRLTDPSIIDVYNKNLNYILKKRNLSIKKISNSKPKERLSLILKNTHDISKSEIKTICKYSYKYQYENIEKITKDNVELYNELNKITSSRGYKLLEKIWKVKGKISHKKK